MTSLDWLVANISKLEQGRAFPNVDVLLPDLKADVYHADPIIYARVPFIETEPERLQRVAHASRTHRLPQMKRAIITSAR